MRTNLTKMISSLKSLALLIMAAAANPAIAGEIRAQADYLTLFHETADFLKTKNMAVEPGVYLATPAAQLNDRKDLQNLIDGAKWDNPFGAKLPVTVGFSPGTVAGTESELWAKYDGRFFLLKAQDGRDQRVSLGVPRAIIPALDGAFVISGKSRIAFISHALRDGAAAKVQTFDDVPEVVAATPTELTTDGRGLIYFSDKDSDKKTIKVSIVRNDGSHGTLAVVPVDSKGQPEAAVTREGIMSKKSDTEVQLIPLAKDGQDGAAQVIFTARSGQTILFKNNMAILQVNRSEGGRGFYYIRRDGSRSEASFSNAAAPAIEAEGHRLLLTYGEDWVRKAEMGQFTDLVPREDFVDRVLSMLKGKENTWVNVNGEFGVGKSSILKLVAARITEERKASSEWKDYSVYHIPFSAFVNLKNMAAPAAPAAGAAPVAPGELPLPKIMAAITGKQVVILIDDFLDDPSLGPSNPAKSMDAFLELFRTPISTGQLRIVTSSDPASWGKLQEGNPQLANLAQVVNLREGTDELTEAVLRIELKRLEKEFRLNFDGDVSKIIMRSSRELYPSFREPGRSIRAAGDLARNLGKRAINAPIARVTEQDARTFYLTNVLDSKRLEKIDVAKFRTFLEGRLLGQPEASERIVDAVASLSLGVMGYDRALATLFLIGPTGTGKTHAADLIAEYLGLPSVKINMNHFSGFSPDTPYTKEIKALTGKPYVLVLDDIDKAGNAASILSEIRSLFEDGIYAQGSANELNLRNAIVVVTGNYGSKVILDNADQTVPKLLTMIQKDASETQEASQKIPPHVWSRIESSIVIFKPLSAETLTAVAREFAKELALDVQQRFNIKLVVADDFITNQVSRSVERSLGASPIEAQIRNTLKNRIAVYLTEVRQRDPEKHRAINEIYVTVNSEEQVIIIDNTDSRYNAIRSNR